MAGVDKRLTDQSETALVTNNDIVHVVKTSDISQNPAGSSYKIKISNLFGSWGAENTLNKTDDVETNKGSSDFYSSCLGLVTWVLNYLFSNSPTKTTLVDADVLALGDSADNNKTKKIPWIDFKGVLLSYLRSQTEVGTTQDVQTSWNGKLILFTNSCTITIPSSLPDNFAFEFVTLSGVTVTWAISSPKTWLFGTPSATVEKTSGSLFQRGATNSIILLV